MLYEKSSCKGCDYILGDGCSPDWEAYCYLLKFEHIHAISYSESRHFLVKSFGTLQRVVILAQRNLDKRQGRIITTRTWNLPTILMQTQFSISETEPSAACFSYTFPEFGCDCVFSSPFFSIPVLFSLELLFKHFLWHLN